VRILAEERYDFTLLLQLIQCNELELWEDIELDKWGEEGDYRELNDSGQFGTCMVSQLHVVHNYTIHQQAESIMELIISKMEYIFRVFLRIISQQ